MTKPTKLSLTQRVLMLMNARPEPTPVQMIRAVLMSSVHSVVLAWPILKTFAARTHVQKDTHAPTVVMDGTIASHQQHPTRATVTLVPIAASSSSVWWSTMPAFVPMLPSTMTIRTSSARITIAVKTWNAALTRLTTNHANALASLDILTKMATVLMRMSVRLAQTPVMLILTARTLQAHTCALTTTNYQTGGVVSGWVFAAQWILVPTALLPNQFPVHLHTAANVLTDTLRLTRMLIPLSIPIWPNVATALIVIQEALSVVTTSVSKKLASMLPAQIQLTRSTCATARTHVVFTAIAHFLLIRRSASAIAMLVSP